MFSIGGSKIWVAGHLGMVGSALVRRLDQEQCEIVTASRAELDLTRQAEVEAWLSAARPDLIFLAAARVGGIHANAAFPADFIYQNLVIQTNVIEAARRCRVSKLVFFGSSCTYPKFAPQPVAEDQLLAGPPELTNVWYAVAKIAGLKMVEAYRQQYGSDFINLMPANTYGPGDNFDLQASHVIPAMIRKFHAAREQGLDHVELWGTGTPLREFLFTDDLADAAVFLAEHYSAGDLVNIGTREEVAIGTLAEQVAVVTGFQGRIVFNTNKPDGAPRKLLDSTRLRGLGWRPKTSLAEGLIITYEWFKQHQANIPN
jgi:GDP-L-fucose synthase